MTEYPDYSFVKGVHEGEASVFTELVRVYLHPLTRYAFSFLGDEDSAHDIVQDVFARVWQLGREWEPNGAVAAYLFLAVRRRALNLLRDSRVRTTAQDALRNHLEHVLVETDPYADVALAQRITQEIHHLTDRQRDALRLRYGHDHTMPQVAALLGIDVKSAERLVSRALTSLRSRLTRVHGEIKGTNL